MLVCPIDTPKNGKDFQRNSSFPQYEQNDHTLAKEFLPRRIIKFIILVDPTLLTFTVYAVSKNS